MALTPPKKSKLSTEQIIIPGTPGAPNVGIQPTPDTVVTTQVDLRKEYVAAGGLTWYGVWAKSLPEHIDDVTGDFGVDTYEAMLHDSQCASAVNTVKAGILEDGVQLGSAIDDEDDPEYGRAQQLLSDCNRMKDGLDTPIDDVAWEMLDAIALGNRLAELVYDVRDGQLRPVRIKTKPRTAFAYVVDPYNAVLGLLAQIPGMYSTTQVGTILSDLQHLPNFLPRQKFWHYAFRMKDSDPRGTSILRPAYNPWYLKQRLWPEYLRYLVQFASPSIWGTTPPGALPQMIGGVQTTSEQVLLDNMLKFQNGSAIALRDGSLINTLFSGGDGKAFLDAFKAFDHQITKGVLNQTLATDEGTHMSRAASSTHQDVLDTLITQAKKAFAASLRRDLLKPFMVLNYDPSWHHLLPTVAFGSEVQQDISAEITATAAAYTAGMIDASQLPGFDERFGWPERVVDADVTAPQQAADQQAQTAQQQGGQDGNARENTQTTSA